MRGHDAFLGALPEPVVSSLRSVGRLAREAGASAWLVGGAVRDLLLERAVQDVDVVAEGDAPALARRLAAAHGGSVRIHDRFQTASWTPPAAGRIDLASARIETYRAPAALPVVAPGDLAQDLFRRDFTLNAMAVSLDPASFGRLLDPYGGASDLRRGILRVLHPRSFRDDPTRAFRAARFAAELGLRVDRATAGWLGEAIAAGWFEGLSAARLRREVARGLGGSRPDRVARKLAALGLLRVLHPDLAPSASTWRDVRRTARVLRAHRARFSDERPAAWALALALLADDLGAQGRRALAARLAPTRTERAVIEDGTVRARRLAAALARSPDPRRSLVHAACAAQRLETVLLALVVAPLPPARRALTRYLTRDRFARALISGRDLIRSGVPEGPRVARGLRAALRAQLDGRAVDRAGELRTALRAARPA